MISWRYHIVSIVAVFLALAVGVLIGTTVVKQSVINDLSRRTDAAVARSNGLRTQVNDLQAELRNWSAFGKAVAPLLIAGQPSGHQVVIVTADGVDLSELDGVRQALVQSGATVLTALVATARMGLPDQGSRTEVAQLVGSADATNPNTLAEEAAARLGARLASGPDGNDDFLRQLVSSRFVVLRGSSGGTDSVGGPGQAFVVLSGGRSQPSVDTKHFFAPLVASLVGSARSVVAAETTETIYPFVPFVRQDGSLAGSVVTVDNADTMAGQIALVLGLRDLLVGGGGGGNYGVKAGASGLLPKSP